MYCVTASLRVLGNKKKEPFDAARLFLVGGPRLFLRLALAYPCRFCRPKIISTIIIYHYYSSAAYYSTRIWFCARGARWCCCGKSRQTAAAKTTRRNREIREKTLPRTIFYSVRAVAQLYAYDMNILIHRQLINFIVLVNGLYKKTV